MSLEPILEGAECWCRSNVGGQTVPHRRTSDGECPVSKTKSGARDDEVCTPTESPKWSYTPQAKNNTNLLNYSFYFFSGRLPLWIMALAVIEISRNLQR